MLNKFSLRELIVTFFYIGKIKYCPGTFGSLAAFPLLYIIMHFIITNQAVFSFNNLNPIESQLLTLFLANILICKVLFIIGIYFSSHYIKQTLREDPKEIVIDEVVGQMLTVTLCFFSIAFIHHSKIEEHLGTNTIDFIFLFALPFGLFRFFDIIKPCWPINWIDQNVKGGLGVMLDDVLAGLFAAITHYALIFLLLDWFG